MIEPKFNYRDIRYGVGDGMFERGLDLFKSGKVMNFTADLAGYSAQVAGSSTYEVYVAQKAFDVGFCDCYMGQRDELCKHMLAVGLRALYEAKLIDDNGQPLEQLPATLAERKALLAAGMRKIMPYTGPSRTWFAYQSKLDVSAGMIREAVSGLKPDAENARFLWNTVKRIDRKLGNGVDDSNGTVWPVASEIVVTLSEWANASHELDKLIRSFASDNTDFDFHEELAAKLESMGS